MAINLKTFVPRPGIVNKQGCLPDPCELVCIEVPKVFDQCLIKRCLIYAATDTESTDNGLRQPVTNPQTFIGCRDFNVKLKSVSKVPLKCVAGQRPGFKKVILNFEISFTADYIDTTGATKSVSYCIARTETISKLYCPDSVAQISANGVDEDTQIIKLELVAECLDGIFEKTSTGQDVLNITLGFHLIVKAELMVQLLVPTYDYCPVPKPCEIEPIEDPCQIFDAAPIPKFYPEQNLEPLFPDCNATNCDE